MLFGQPQNNSTYSSFPQTYSQTPAPYQQAAYPQQQPSPYPQQQPGLGPPDLALFPNNQAFAPPQQYPPPGGSPFSPQYQNAMTQPYNSISPPIPFQQSQFQPPQTQTPPQFPSRPTNLPAAPGLPQRPSFGAPPVNAFQMQQMHQGQIPGSTNPHDAFAANQPGAPSQYGRPPGSPPSGITGGSVSAIDSRQLHSLAGGQESLSANATSLDDLLSGAAKAADKADTAAASKAEPRTDEAHEERKGKKEKEKSTKLIYSDNDVSPEEKMAQMPRYALVPDGNDSGGAAIASITVTTGSAQ